MRSLDPLQPLANLRLLDQDLALSLATRRFVMLLLATFAVAAVALAAIGIYGVISYMVGPARRATGSDPLLRCGSNDGTRPSRALREEQ